MSGCAPCSTQTPPAPVCSSFQLAHQPTIVAVAIGPAVKICFRKGIVPVATPALAREIASARNRVCNIIMRARAVIYHIMPAAASPPLQAAKLRHHFRMVQKLDPLARYHRQNFKVKLRPIQHGGFMPQAHVADRLAHPFAAILIRNDRTAAIRSRQACNLLHDFQGLERRSPFTDRIQDNDVFLDVSNRCREAVHFSA